MPRLSVLMAVKDGERTVRSAVTSTLRAMHRDAELVVLDDGSTDGTLAALARIDDGRLRVIVGGTNVGYARARARLLRETDSHAIAIMDADDVSLPWRLFVQMRRLHTADLVLAPVIRFSTGPPRISSGMPAAIGADAMPLHLLIGCPLAHPTLVARRAAVEAVGGYRDVVAEDYDLYLRAITAGQRVVRVALPTLGYRIHDHQTSRDTSFQSRMAQDQAFQDAVDIFLLAEFGYDRLASERPSNGRLLPTSVIDALLSHEVAARDIAPVAARLLDRYRRRELGV